MGDGEMRRCGDGGMGRCGDAEMGRWGDGEIWRWGDAEIWRWGGWGRNYPYPTSIDNARFYPGQGTTVIIFNF